MKKIYLLMLTVLGLMSSCGSDEILEGDAEKTKHIFTAETEIPGSTRTSLYSERNISWTYGDHLAIFDKCTKAEEYELTAGMGSPNGRFSRVTTSGCGDSDSELSHVIAVYPYCKDYVATNTSLSGFKIENVEIPSEQTYVENSFSNSSMPMVAVTDNNLLKFKNVGALIKLNIKSIAPSVGINKITIESCSTSKDVIAGKSVITVGADGHNPSIAMKSDGSTKITLNCNNVRLSPTTATSFYIALPPMNFANGFVVTIYDDASQTMTLKSKSSDIKRNQIMVMPTIIFKSSDSSSVPSHVKWVDLGLPSGVKWANCNVGANSPEEYGNYYAWGEIITKNDYSQDTYLYCKSDKTGGYVYERLIEISGYAKYDAACANWGGTARIPTFTEFRELAYNCTWTWTTQKGVNGYLVTSKSNGNSIFLPAAGYRDDTSLYCLGERGYYWGSSLYNDYADCGHLAYDLYFYDSYRDGSHTGYRCNGQSVRPVSD